MYSKTAQWYDAIYSSKDYKAESDLILSLLKKEHPTARSLLDVACGTAEHDRYLAEIYEVDGIDINPEFVEIASRKNPQCSYFTADMTGFSLDRTYDIVLCLFSSIGYVKTLDNLVKALRCFERHLNAGGIIVVEPWFVPEAWRPGERVYMDTGETDTGKVCRMSLSGQEGSLSILNFHYLVGTLEGISYVTERHELGLFSVEEMLFAFKEADLVVAYDEEGLTGRGLCIARRGRL